MLETAKKPFFFKPTTADYHMIRTIRENLNFIDRQNVKPSIETAKRAKMRCLSQNLVKETLFDVFTTGYCTATDGTKNFSFLFLESVVIEISNQIVLVKTPNQNLDC